MLQKSVRQFRLLIAVIGLLLILPTMVLAAPLLQTNCNTDSVAHSSNTENQMVVCSGGKIGGLYQFHLDGVRSDNALNNLYSPPSTLAIHFNEHGSTVDVGQQDEFEITTRPMLDKPSTTFIGFDENTVTIYRSRGAVKYQITQRTFATNSMLTPWSLTNTDNWVLIEFMVENTGNTPLTGGKLLLMVDISVGTFVGGNKGYYNANKQVFYQTHQPGASSDFRNYGFAMGLNIKSGTLVRAGLSTTPPSYSNDAALLAEINGANNIPLGDFSYGTGDLVHWLVVDLPTLSPGQSYPVAMGMCGTMSGTDSQAAGVVLNCFDKIPLPTVDIIKTTPITAATLGQVVPFTLTVTSRYGLPVSNIQVQDSSMSVTSIGGDNGNNVLEGNERWLYTGSYLVPTTTITSPLVSTSTVRGTWNGFNIGRAVPYNLNIDFQPQVYLTKSSNPAITATIGNTVTYFITATHSFTSDYSPIISPTINDSPISQLVRVTGDTNDNGRLEWNETWVFEVAYKVPPDTSKIFTSTTTFRGVDGNGEEVKGTVAHSLTIVYNPKLKIVKTGPTEANPQTFVIFSFEVSHADDSDFSPVKKVIVSDDKAGLAQYVTGDVNKNDLLDSNETWFFSAGYFIPASPNPAVNQATVRGNNLDGAAIPVAKSNIHRTDILESEANIGVIKKGPERAGIGDKIRYTFNVNHISGSSFVTITDITDKIITPTLFAGGDTISENEKLDPGETWIYTVDYVVPTTATNPIINTVTVKGTDNLGHRVVASAQKITYLDFSAKLSITLVNTPSQLHVGQTITPTFAVSHASNSDGSPVNALFVLDIFTGIVFCTPSGNGDTFLDKGETWTCVGKSYTVKPTDPNTMLYSATVQATDRTFATITKTLDYTYTVNFQPTITLTQTSSPPYEANAGETIVYTLTLNQAADSDLSPVYSPTVTTDIPGVPVLISNGNGDNQLDGSETWLYQVTYTVPPTVPMTLTHTTTITGFDGNGRPVTVTSLPYTLLVHFHPALTITVTPSTLPGRGGVMTYPMTITHDIENSDSSPICDLSLNVPELGLNQRYTDEGDNCLSPQEQWLVTPTYQIPNIAASPLHFTTIVTGRDTEQDPITVINNQAVILAGPVLIINIITNTRSISVGIPMVFTVTVSQSPTSATQLDVHLDTSLEREEVISSVKSSRVNIGPAETVTYQVTYTPTITDEHVMTPTITVTGQYEGENMVLETASLPLTIWHNPALMADTMGMGKSLPGSLVQYVLQIAHATNSDKSMAYLQSVEGVAFFTCSTGGHELPFGSSCLYTVTVPAGTLNYSVPVVYTDVDEDIVTMTIPLKLIKQIDLPMVIKNPREKLKEPVLILEIKTNPITALPGDTIQYQFIVKHDLEIGDGTAVCNLKLIDIAPPPPPNTKIDGPVDDNCLNANETWVYKANLPVPVSGKISAKITGRSSDVSNKEISATAEHIVPLPQNCHVEKFDDSSSGWLTSGLPVLREYTNGRYHFLTQDDTQLWWSRSTWQPQMDYELLLKVDMMNVTNRPESYGVIIEQSSDIVFYAFVISNTTKAFALYKYQNNGHQPLFQGTYPGILTDLNTLRVDRKGDGIKLYINNQLVTASPINVPRPNSPRYVGVNLLSFDGQSGEVYYDDFTLCSDSIQGLSVPQTSLAPALSGGNARP